MVKFHENCFMPQKNFTPMDLDAVQLYFVSPVVLIIAETMLYLESNLSLTDFHYLPNSIYYNVELY